MEDRVLTKLEYHRILQFLTDCADTATGKELAAAARPLTAAYAINLALDETGQAKELLRLHPTFSLGGVHDLRPLEKKAALGGVIEAPEFLLLLDTLRAAGRIREFFQDTTLPFPALREMSEGLHPLPRLEAAIAKAITGEGEVADRATPELAKLRARLRALRGKAKEKLEAMVRNPEIGKYLQDPIVSIRGDRYVLPVRLEYRQQVPGIVHDQSGSGATIFVEPLPVVEINQETRQCELLERAEVIRVLRQLTEQTAACGDELALTREGLTRLDFALAKGKLSARGDWGRPAINEAGRIFLRQARHPLIRGRVVPVTVELGRDFDAIVVTGPNTGGKTALLKTIGLLTLMAQAGLYVPAEDGTELAVFQRVYADIGDEQSIEQSLSTFSAHMTNIIAITAQADSESLVLLDELGAGTDPAEGAALAMAVIEHLVAAGAKLVATTHYSELKSFAASHARAENASVEFDPVSLRPTYRLMMGIPGRSNAFEISLRLGLDPGIVESAKAFQSQEAARTARLISDLETNQILTEKERREATVLRKQAAGALAWIEKKKEDARQRAAKILEDAREEALELLAEARKESDGWLKEIRKMRKAGLQNIQAGDEQAAIKVKEDLRRQENKLYERLERQAGAGAGAAADWEPAPGDLVYLRRLRQKGQVLGRANSQDEVPVLAGVMRLTVSRRDLELLTEEKPEYGEGRRDRGGHDRGLAASGHAGLGAGKARTISPELHLRGKYLEDALEEAEKYLDDAYLAGLAQVRIIHGKGTGALRKAIREMAAKHPLVSGARPGGYDEGGEGVTVLEMRK
ncbi:MAG: endonuclease MutS2 [Peptococcaceae bacterium]|jgi:DNA mismatch repair protein MutS2|nr:endonuclease MutS2 [Peptococcaceae bacterium]